MSELTARRIETAKPDATRDRVLWDGDGLGLKVAPTGRKSFVYRYLYAGRRRTMTLGPYPVLGLAEAREARRVQHALLLAGRDPLLARDTAQRSKVDGVRVSEAIEAFHDQFLKREFKTPLQAVQLLRKNLNPVVGEILVADVEPPMITDAINRIVARGARVTANRVIPLARKFFDWCRDQHFRQRDNPVTISKRNAGGREKPKTSKLEWDQIKEVLALMRGEDTGCSPQVRLGLLLMMATAKRPIEVVTLEWKDVDLERGTWWNPKVKTKSGIEAHLVFLSSFAVGILRELWDLTGHTPWVFLSPFADLKRPKPMQRHSLSRAVLRLHQEGKLSCKFTPHDFRRTFATRMADLKVEPYVVEKILHHQMEGVMAVYNNATYYDERKAAMDLWGKKLDELSATNGQSVSGD